MQHDDKYIRYRHRQHRFSAYFPFRGNVHSWLSSCPCEGLEQLFNLLTDFMKLGMNVMSLEAISYQ